MKVEKIKVTCPTCGEEWETWSDAANQSLIEHERTIHTTEAEVDLKKIEQFCLVVVKVAQDMIDAGYKDKDPTVAAMNLVLRDMRKVIHEDKLNGRNQPTQTAAR